MQLMQRSSGPTTKAFVFKSDVSFQILPKFKLQKTSAVKNGSVHPNGDSALFCLHKERERESRRRRLSDGKRATRRFNWSSSNAPLCQRTFCTPPPPPPAPVLEMGLDWRPEQFARNLRLDAATILNYYCRLLLTGPSNIYLHHGHVTSREYMHY